MGPQHGTHTLGGQLLIRHRQHGEFVRFQSNLLGEHDVARDQTTKGHKTPANFGATSGVDLTHVRHDAIVDTVTLSAVAADNIEISFGVKLGALFGR